MTTAILALQGAFIEHATMLATLDEPTFEIRQRRDLLRSFDRLVLPGGESSVQKKLLHELDLFNELSTAIRSGMPTLGTCAGLILLAEKLTSAEASQEQENAAHPRYSGFGTLPVEVERNAYGRQLGSFVAQAPFTPSNPSSQSIAPQKESTNSALIPMTFIRAPRITHLLDDGVHVLACHHDTPTAVQYHKQIGIAFHPELDSDTTIHEYFLSL